MHRISQLVHGLMLVCPIVSRLYLFSVIKVQVTEIFEFPIFTSPFNISKKLHNYLTFLGISSTVFYKSVAIHETVTLVMLMEVNVASFV